MEKLILLMMLLITYTLNGQADTTVSPVTFTVYAEVYYAYDFNQPSDHNRPAFIYSHNRHNEFNLNLGFVKTTYSSNSVRANVALAAGTYMNANYSAEPGVLKNIYEANAGLKLCKSKNVWIDAGIFTSHIGFESAVSKDCWVLTRSILADNSPYYESGAKVTYVTDDSKWLLSALILNGWQHIQRPDGNNTPAFGTQITFNPNTNIILNYSTFIGNDKSDEIKQIRYFHNLYGMFHVTDKFHVTAGFDYGMEQKSKGSSDYNNWYSPVLIVKVIISDKWSLGGRAEYYVDENGVIIPTGTVNGFKTTGFSVNLDYKIQDNAVWRVEGRTLNSKDGIFIKDGNVGNTDAFVTSSLAILF